MFPPFSSPSPLVVSCGAVVEAHKLALGEVLSPYRASPAGQVRLILLDPVAVTDLPADLAVMGIEPLRFDGWQAFAVPLAALQGLRLGKSPRAARKVMEPLPADVLRIVVLAEGRVVTLDASARAFWAEVDQAKGAGLALAKNNPN